MFPLESTLLSLLPAALESQTLARTQEAPARTWEPSGCPKTAFSVNRHRVDPAVGPCSPGSFCAWPAPAPSPSSTALNSYPSREGTEINEQRDQGMPGPAGPRNEDSLRSAQTTAHGCWHPSLEIYPARISLPSGEDTDQSGGSAGLGVHSRYTRVKARLATPEDGRVKSEEASQRRGPLDKLLQDKQAQRRGGLPARAHDGR